MFFPLDILLINKERENRLNAGIEYNSKFISLDSGVQRSLFRAMNKKVKTFPVKIRTIENEFVNFAVQEGLETFFDLHSNAVDLVWSESFTVKDLIKTASTITEVETAFNDYMGV